MKKNRYKKIDMWVVDQVTLEVQNSLTKIFGSEMIFGFICGGFAKGYADKRHDVDIFVCTKNKIDKKMEEKYLKWYFQLHEKYDFKADCDFPGEIIDYKYLIKTLKKLEKLELTLKIDSVQTKKSIIWADMIVSQTSGHAGIGLKELYKLKNKYREYPEKWKQEVLNLISNEERNEWADKSQLFIMEKFMIYPKFDGRKLDKNKYL